MTNTYKGKQIPSPRREKVTQLQKEIGLSLISDDAKTNVPCPVADEIFDQLFGRLWLQGAIIKKHVTAEDLLNIIKLDYEATIEFYRQRKASTFRETVYPEEDQDLRELLREERELEARISSCRQRLAALEERERVEMAKWRIQHEVDTFVHAGRVETLHARQTCLQLRNDLLSENVDLLEGATDLFDWANERVN